MSNGKHIKRPEHPIWLLFGETGQAYYVAATSPEAAVRLVADAHPDERVSSAMRAHIPHLELKPIKS